MSLITVSGTKNAIQVRRAGVTAHLPCHSALVRISTPNQPAIDIYAIFTPAPLAGWLIGAKGQAAVESVVCSEYSVAVADNAAVEVVIDEGTDRTELF